MTLDATETTTVDSVPTTEGLSVTTLQTPSSPTSTITSQSPLRHISKSSTASTQNRLNVPFSREKPPVSAYPRVSPTRTRHAPSQSPVRNSSTRRASSVFNFVTGLDIPSQSDQPLEEALNVASKRRGVYNLVQVPLRLERLLFFGQAICLHDFLATFTFLPLRLVAAFTRLLFSLLLGPFLFVIRTLFPKFRAPPPTESQRTALVRSRVQIGVDVINASLLTATVVVLRALDTSRIYHNIRGQSVVKIYVVFNVIEIFDRLCSSFGIDMLDSLGWTTASAIAFFLRTSIPNLMTTESASPTHKSSIAGRALQGLVLLTRVAFDYIFTLVYLVLHATLLLTWIVTLNVAINTQNNALLTLLVSNNFVELKSCAFKSFKVPNVFQIAVADAVERFQLSVFLIVMIIVTDGDPRLFKTWSIIYGCEIVVDWIKHAFVSKFNRISYRVYHMFGLVVCDDMVRTRAQTAIRAVGGSAVSKKIGFVSLPLAAVVVRMVWDSASHMPPAGVFLLWTVFVVMRATLSLALIGHAWRRVRTGTQSDVADEERERDEYWFHKLSQVERYDQISKS